MKLKGVKNWIICVSLLATHTCIGQPTLQQKTIYASNYVLPSDSDAILGVLNLLKAARSEGATRIVFKKGIYHFYSNRAFEKLCFISNHDSGPKRIAFPLLGFKNLEIDGNGSEFIMHGLIIPFAIENSSNIKINNLSIDGYRPTYSALKVVAVDSEKNYIDFKISDKYPYEIRHSKLIFVKKDFEFDLNNCTYWNPKTNAVAYQSRRSNNINRRVPSVTNFKDTVRRLYEVDHHDPLYVKRGVESSTSTQQLKPGLVRITGVNPSMPKVGWTLVCKGTNGNNRLAPAVWIDESNNVMLENVNVHHASGMGLIAQSSANITLNHFNVFPKPEDHRMVSTTADATHFVNCRGLIKIEHCLFKNQFDDATNIHGVFLEITDIEKNTNTVGVHIGHFQQVGIDFAHPGDSIAAVNPKINELPIVRLIVKNIKKINPRYYKITFDKPIPENIRIGFNLVNLAAYPRVVIKNNRFVDNKARGLLISTPRKVVIEGNVFSNMMMAIKCHSGFSFWYESGYVKNLIIRNNTFLDGYYGAGKSGWLIDIAAFSANDDLIHGKIIIENNTFNSFASGIVRANSVKELQFKNNVIKYSGNYPIHPNLPIVKLQSVGRAEIINNKYDARFKNFISKEDVRGTLINRFNETNKME